MYDLLRQYAPFKSLPHSDEIEFRVVRDRTREGYYTRRGATHIIAVSDCHATDPIHALEIMAHEMLHLAQALKGRETRADHNRPFVRAARVVCQTFHWELSAFVGPGSRLAARAGTRARRAPRAGT